MSIATGAGLGTLLMASEDELVARVLEAAREIDYARHAARMPGPWRASIAGLTDAIARALASSQGPAGGHGGARPGGAGGTDLAADPVTAFGVLEAQRHRARGLGLPEFLGLMKQYARCYVELIDERVDDAAERTFASRFVRSFFDRLELAVCSDWARTTESERLEEVRAANRRLVAEKNRFQVMLESAALPVLFFAEDGRLVHMNTAAVRLLGAAPRDAAGSAAVPLPWLPGELARFGDDSAVERVIERRAELPGGPRELEVRLRRSLDAIGTLDGYVVTLADITEKVARERALREARDGLEERVAARTRQLAQAIEALHEEVLERTRAEEERRRLEAQVLLSQKLESLGVLAGGIAHDFNNLLTAIVGNAELAQLQLADDALAQDALANVLRAAERAAELCRQMLTYAGGARLDSRRVALRGLVEEMAALLAVAVPKHVRLETRCLGDDPVVEADPSQLRQVLLNLVTNAAEAIGERPGRVTVSLTTEDVAAATLERMEHGRGLPGGRYAVIEVADDGCGMTAEVRDRVFEPFFTTKFTGRGLGLPTVFGIVRGHRGALEIDSTPGAGTRIKVVLPAAEPAAADSLADALAESEASGAVSGGGMLALVVDDEESVRDVGRALLEREGFRVVTACDGEDALTVLREGLEGPRVVLLDLTMPRRDGLSTLAALRETNPNVPIVLMSGYDQHNVADAVRAVPRVAILQKPFDRGRLRAALRRACL